MGGNGKTEVQNNIGSTLNSVFLNPGKNFFFFSLTHSGTWNECSASIGRNTTNISDVSLITKPGLNRK